MVVEVVLPCDVASVVVVILAPPLFFRESGICGWVYGNTQL